MTDREHLSAHVQFFRELGVDGVSSDDVWRVPGVSLVGRMKPKVELAGTLKEIREEIGDCTRCKLHAGRTNLVFGVGNPTFMNYV